VVHDACVTADAFITCRVTSETKALVRRLAEQRGVNESALIKQLLYDALGSSLPAARVPAAVRNGGRREERVTVRMTAEDRQLLAERAASRGLAPGTYVAILVRSHVLGRVPLPRAEHSALRQCVMELTAIGRNLEEIAKAIDENGKASLPGRAEVAAMLKVAVGLRDHFKEILKANEASWRSGAQTTH
jgi:predicted DNA binding CopG/RHH family protein